MIVQSIYAADREFGRQLSFALLLLNHFTGQPIEEELSVASDVRVQPVLTSDKRRRNADGTYRFIDLPAGNHAVTYVSSSGYYASFDAPLSVLTPIATPQTAIKRDLWPTPAAPIPTGMTAIRGSISGATFKNVKVEIAAQGQPFDRFTYTDLSGNFVFLIATRLNPIAANDPRTALSVQLNGGALSIQNIDVVLNGATAVFSGTSNFELKQGATSRVMLAVS